MSVHNFPKKVYLEVEDVFDGSYWNYTNLNQAEVGSEVAVYELVEVRRAAVTLTKIKPEETL